MGNFMKKLTDSNEWVELNNGIATIGLSNMAIKHIGEIVNVKLPSVGKEIKKDEEVVILESTKAAIDVYSPLSGKIIAVNESIKENLNWINQSPEKEGWLYKIKIFDIKEFEDL